MHGHAGTQGGEALKVFLEVNVPVPHRRPLHHRAVFVFPNGRVAQAGGNGVGAEILQTLQRVFKRPAGVAGIHIGAHKIFASIFNEPHQFRRVHIACVIFYGDLHPGIYCQTALAFEHLHRVSHASVDSTLALAIFGVAEDDTKHRRTQCLSHADAKSKMLLCCIPARVFAPRL